MGKGNVRISIRYKLFAVITVLIISMTTVIGTVMIRRQKKQYLDQLVQFGVFVASYQAQACAEPLLYADELAMSLLVRDVSRNPQVVEAMVLDKDGIIRAHNNLEKLGTFYVAPRNTNSTDELGRVTLHHLIDQKESLLEFVSPVEYPDMRIGTVHLILSRNYIDRDISQATWFVIGLAVVLMVVGAGLSLILSTVLLKPIQSLVRGTREIAGGNFDFHVDVHKNDEMGDLANAFNGMARDLQMKRVIEESFGRYVSPHIVDRILENPDQIWVGGANHEVSLFFADIRGFTTLTERIPPEELLALLNGYFSLATEVIVKHRGYIDKFVGDAVMAVFGAPVADPDHPINAVRALIDLRDRMADYNAAIGNGIQLRVGMGATLGQVVAGNVGSQTRMEYTVMGDTVNVASRLTQMAKPGDILISSTLYQRASSMIRTEEVGEIHVKGREKPVMVYRVLRSETERNVP
ncbi:MAG: HAMP domain-containing protein [Deltaproteobacteria bacterium]|nr:HAMP domain-containing protein [Deltaproteobacteria bacterium]